MVEYPQPIVVEAAVSRDYPIGGLTAVGWLYEPDGNWLPVDFHDDGVAPDRIADDGTYSAYVDYTQDGEHWITVHFDNSAGTGFYTDRGLMTTGSQTLPAITENFERYAEYQMTVAGWQEDDHTDWPGDPDWPATPLTLDNMTAPGRIDFENDADVFQITVPNDYTETLGVRINRLGLGMDPYVYVYAADYSWQFERYLEYTPTSDDALFIPVDMTPGETFYVEVWHYYEDVAAGTYNVSAGPYLSSDLIAEDKLKALGRIGGFLHGPRGLQIARTFNDEDQQREGDEIFYWFSTSVMACSRLSVLPASQSAVKAPVSSRARSAVSWRSYVA